MEETNILEILGVAAIALFVIFFFGRGLRHQWERSARAEKDWGALVVPLLFVVGFIALLIYLV